MRRIGDIEVSEEVYDKLLKSAVAGSIEADILVQIGDKLPEELRTTLEAQVEKDYLQGSWSYLAAVVRLHTDDFDRSEFDLMETPFFKETLDVLEKEAAAVAFQIIPSELLADQAILNLLSTYFISQAPDNGRK